MLINKKFFIPLLITFNTFGVFNLQEFQLTDFDYKSTAVLTTFTKRKEKWVIVTREGYGISKKHTYDAFSGGKDEGETDVVLSGAREFHEEAILQEVLGWSLEHTKKFINPFNNEYTWLTFAYSKDKDPDNPKSRDVRNVTFCVNFTKYKTKLFNNFYDARAREQARYNELGIPGKHRHTTEKDRIAKIRWQDFKNAIICQEHPDDIVTVCADVMNPHTRTFNREFITLRPILVMTFRPFFLNCEYERGENEKIRLYSE